MISFFVGHMAFRSIRFEPVCGCAMAKITTVQFFFHGKFELPCFFHRKVCFGGGRGRNKCCPLYWASVGLHKNDRTIEVFLYYIPYRGFGLLMVISPVLDFW